MRKCRLGGCSCNSGWSRGTVMVEKLVAAVVDSGGCSRWCSMEAGDRLPVLRVASWLVLAGDVAYCRN